MKNFIAFINDYVKHCTVKTITLIKLCVMSFGVLLGLAVPGKHKKKVAVATTVLLLASYVPLVADCVSQYTKKQNRKPGERMERPHYIKLN